MSNNYYDDNFGHYDMSEDQDGEVSRFYRDNARKSVNKKCSICGRMVRILPQYDKCNSCCEKIERGQQW